MTMPNSHRIPARLAFALDVLNDLTELYGLPVWVEPTDPYDSLPCQVAGCASEAMCWISGPDYVMCLSHAMGCVSGAAAAI